MNAQAEQIYTTSNDMYQIGGYVFQRATLRDDDTIKMILKTNEMDSWIKIATEHEPSYFNATNLFGSTEAILSRTKDTGEIVGMCSFTKMRTHYNGKPVDLGYLGELRVVPKFRNNLKIIRYGFESIKNISNLTNKIWFTSIAKENNVARRLLEANLKGMPRYRRIGELATLAFSVNRKKVKLQFESASKSDIPILVEFYNKYASEYQYSPELNTKWLSDLNGQNGISINDFYILKDGSDIQACFAIWDQRNIKQTVVRGYRFPLNLFRIPYNLFSSFFSQAKLPAVNNKVNYIFISFLTVSEHKINKSIEILDAALSEIKKRNAGIGMVGLSVNNPIYNKLIERQHHSYITCIEEVSFCNEGTPLDVNDSENFVPVQPEIAML